MAVGTRDWQGYEVSAAIFDERYDSKMTEHRAWLPYHTIFLLPQTYSPDYKYKHEEFYVNSRSQASKIPLLLRATSVKESQPFEKGSLSTGWHQVFTFCLHPACSESIPSHCCSTCFRYRWNSSNCRSSWSLYQERIARIVRRGSVPKRKIPRRDPLPLATIRTVSYSGTSFPSTSWCHQECCSDFLGCWFRTAW